MKNNIVITLLLGVVVSATALYFAFRNVPGADLLAYMATIDWFWVLCAVVIALMSFGLRVVRWQVILGTRFNIGFRQAYHPLMIGFMINCILPGRVGELARPVILRRKSNVPLSTGLATVAAERVFDLLMLIALFAVVMSTVDIDPGLDIPFGDYHLNKKVLLLIVGGMLKLSLVLIAGIILVGFETTRTLIKKIIMAMPAMFFFAGDTARLWIEQKICMPLTALVENVATGFSQVKHPKSLIFCIGLSFAVWVLVALSYYVMSIGCPGIELSFTEITATMVIICFFIALPSVPGFWGIWEAAGVFALFLFGVAQKDAAGYTLANHAIQIIPVVLLGIISALITGINILTVSKENR